MCGIGGILRVTPAGEQHTPIPDSWLDLIDRSIAHRGPDGAGRFRDRVVRADGSTVEVALVHRRLAVIDVEDGQQPMVVDSCPACARLMSGKAPDYRARVRRMADGSEVQPLVAVAFNGCIYNHRELRRELEDKGHVFQTDHSDTEVIAHLYAEAWAEHEDRIDFVDPNDDPATYAAMLMSGRLADRLDGMYSFAIWDRFAGELVLGRDRFGEKPLYWRSSPQRRLVAFASTIPGVRALEPEFRPSIDLRSMDTSRYVRPYRNIMAEWCSLGFGRADDTCREVVEVRSVLVMGWLVPVCPQDHLLIELLLWIAMPFLMVVLILSWLTMAIIFMLESPFVAWRNRLRKRRKVIHGPDWLDQLLDAAIASRLESDVPLGCFLSGGVDSSLIAYYASRHVSNLTTLTVRMPDERYDESRYAEIVADHLGTSHITLDCDGQSAADDLVHLIGRLGLPFGDSSLLPTYWLCREARKHVTVALSGDGADELFYGYDRYRAMRPMRWLRHIAWAIPTRGLDRSDPKSRSDRLARLIIAARHKGYADLLAIFPTPDRRRLLGRRSSGIERRVGSAQKARAHDLEHYLPSDILRKTDTASMAVALEVRAPFLAREVVEAALATPARRHMAHSEGKHLLKELARRHLPREVVDRPKQGFAIPIGEWLRSDFGGLRTLMLDKLMRPRPFGSVHDVLDINTSYVERMIEEHDAAGDQERRARSVRPRDHGQRLYALTVLAVWAEGLEG